MPFDEATARNVPLRRASNRLCDALLSLLLLLLLLLMMMMMLSDSPSVHADRSSRLFLRAVDGWFCIADKKCAPKLFSASLVARCMYAAGEGGANKPLKGIYGPGTEGLIRPADTLSVNH